MNLLTKSQNDLNQHDYQQVVLEKKLFFLVLSFVLDFASGYLCLSPTSTNASN